MRGVWNWIVTRTADYGLPKQIELIDIVQILLIAFFVYHLIRWLQNTKAYTLMKGIFLIGVFVIMVDRAEDMTGLVEETFCGRMAGLVEETFCGHMTERGDGHD